MNPTPNGDYAAELTEKLYATTDASVWAEEFCRIASALGHSLDEGWVIGWFANAIETAKSHTLAQHPERRPVHDQDFVLLPRDPLFEFLGEMALPPWTDEHGETIGSGIDCAPIAERLSRWVADHDLGDLYHRWGDEEPDNPREQA